MKIVIDITQNQADALAQVLKRVGYSHIRPAALDDSEAYAAQLALEEIRRAFAEQGFNPR